MLDSSRTAAHRTRLSGREQEHLLANTGTATGMAIGIIITTTTVSSLSVASHSLATGTLSDTLMDTGTAIPTVATTLLLTTVAATMGLVTTAVDITVTVTMAAVPMVRFTLATPTVQAMDPNRV